VCLCVGVCVYSLFLLYSSAYLLVWWSLFFFFVSFSFLFLFAGQSVSLIAWTESELLFLTKSDVVHAIGEYNTHCFVCYNVMCVRVFVCLCVCVFVCLFFVLAYLCVLAVLIHVRSLYIALESAPSAVLVAGSRVWCGTQSGKLCVATSDNSAFEHCLDHGQNPISSIVYANGAVCFVFFYNCVYT
jgi:hypothetical protein